MSFFRIYRLWFAWRLRIDERFKDIPSFKEMIDTFGANKLRHFRLPMQWFEERLGMKVDESYKKDVTERKRIQKLIDSVPDDNPLQSIVFEYLQHQLKKTQQGDIKILSVRLSISAVVDLVKDLSFQVQLEQHFLDKHMVRKPGQKANLTGFINFLNDAEKYNLKLKVDQEKSKKYRRAQLQKKLIALINEPDEARVRRKWMLYGLQYFHALPMRIAGSALKNGNIEETVDGYLIHWNENKYYIPFKSNIDEIRIES